MVTNYERGRAFEHRVKKYLERKWHVQVWRLTCGKPFDLISVDRYGTSKYHECKRRKPSSTEYNKIADLAKKLRHPIWIWTLNKENKIVLLGIVA